MTSQKPRIVPPKPASRAGRFSFRRYIRQFRRDILSANPERLYGAKMAEFRIPFLHTFLVNEPRLWRRALRDAPEDFPKSPRMAAGLEPLLGEGVFISNGALWERQRRLIDPAFEGGRLRDTFPAMWAAGQAALTRLEAASAAQSGPIELDAHMSHATADVIFRTLFSVPIEDETASSVFEAFKAYQGTQPLLNLAGFLPLPHWMPKFHRRKTKVAAKRIRALIEQLVAQRRADLAAGTAPDDLASKIMQARDPQTGTPFSDAEMVDQTAVFFLAGHETSASALSWALYLLALDPELQDALAEEANAELLTDGDTPPDFSVVSRLKQARDVFREALRLYPPVPMFVREARCPVEFRGRNVPKGAQIVVSPWHLGRHTKIWDDPDAFCPARWGTDAGRDAARDGFIPFSTGPRVCPGAGFAMIEGPLLLSLIAQRFVVTPCPDHVPVPAAQLTVRAVDGIWLMLNPRN